MVVCGVMTDYNENDIEEYDSDFDFEESEG